MERNPILAPVIRFPSHAKPYVSSSSSCLETLQPGSPKNLTRLAKPLSLLNFVLYQACNTALPCTPREVHPKFLAQVESGTLYN